jgi:nitrite reductase/ring-hydroxylating ferredoxin subunit
MNRRVEVCSATDLSPGERKLVSADGTSIGVFNVDGEYFAVSNSCCHLDGPVCTGKITREIVAEDPGVGQRTYEYFSDNPTIACPWHGWEYELATGQHIGDENVELDVYPVTEEDGVIYVEV